jgi:hypothetical protein
VNRPVRDVHAVERLARSPSLVNLAEVGDGRPKGPALPRCSSRDPHRLTLRRLRGITTPNPSVAQVADLARRCPLAAANRRRQEPTGGHLLTGAPQSREHQDVDEQSQRGSLSLVKPATWLAAIITVVAALAALTHIIWPELKIDSITVALLVVAFFPWLGFLVSRLKLGNFETEFREWAREEVKEQFDAKVVPNLRDTEERVDQVEQRIDDVDNAVEEAAGFAEVRQHEGEPSMSEDGRSNLDPSDELSELVRQYNDVRANEPPGFERTTHMTRIANEMSRVAPEVVDFQWLQNLESGDRGWRLAAYAYLFAEPRPDGAKPLVRSITKIEDKPFGQYWGLRALKEACSREVVDSATASQLEPTLRAYLAALKPGTDRYMLTRDALTAIERLLRRP